MKFEKIKQWCFKGRIEVERTFPVSLKVDEKTRNSQLKVLYIAIIFLFENFALAYLTELYSPFTAMICDCSVKRSRERRNACFQACSGPRA